eukprot:scaffold11901_cov36-Phaeocystis_antarctica.AAC.1
MKACLLAVISVEIPSVLLVLGASAISVDFTSGGARGAVSLHETAGPVRTRPRVPGWLCAVIARRGRRRRG